MAFSQDNAQENLWRSVLLVSLPGLFTEGLESLIGSPPFGLPTYCLQTVPSLELAQQACAQQLPAMVIVEPSVGRGDYPQLLQSIRYFLEATALIILNSEDLAAMPQEEPYPILLSRRDSASELRAAVLSVGNGHAFQSPHLLAAPSPRDPRSTRLSLREIQVLCCVARGMKARSIGDHLCIKTKTVERHKSNIMGKLGLHSQVDLTLYAVKEGLVGGAGPIYIH